MKSTAAAKPSQARLQVVPEQAAWDENLRLWLVNYLKETGMSTTEFARGAGGSRTLWDDYVKCMYFGRPDPKNDNKIRTTDNSKVEPMLRAYRRRVEGPNSGNRTEFAKTTAATQLWAALRTAVEENAITMAYGNWGVGKTRCTNEFVYKKLKQPAVHIICSPNATTRHFLKLIAKQLGFQKSALAVSIPDLEELIIHFLKSHPRVLVIDQANYLPLKALGSVFYIWEMSGAPVTLVGTQTLYDNFFNPKLTSDERGQLATRVALVYPLTGLDVATVKTICHRVLGEKVATDALVKAIWEKVGGKFTDEGDAMTANFRSLEFRLRRLLKLIKLNPALPLDKVMEMADALLMAA
jgi:DNA transposition AAA+ family ATPase